MKILLVEDEPALCKTMAAVLRLSGHQVASAGNGLEALAQLENESPDLVVLDLQMPDMDGWEFLRRFRAAPGCATIPVLVTSAARSVAVDQLDVQGFMAKPFDVDVLLERVETLLAIACARQSRTTSALKSEAEREPRGSDLPLTATEGSTTA